MTAAVVQNSSVYTAAKLFNTYREHLGRPITPTTATTIARSLGDHYVASGYARPQFQIRDRGTNTGVVRILAIESKVTAVRLGGEPGPYHDRLTALMTALVADKPLRTADLRNTIRQARQMPGLEVDVTTEADDAGNGGYVVVVDSKYRPFTGSMRVSNRGTRETGRNLAFGTIAVNGIGGRPGTGGLFYASATDPKKYLSVGTFGHTLLWSDSTTGHFSGSLTSLEIDTSGVNFEQRRQHITWTVNQSLALGFGSDLKWWGGFEMDDFDIAHDGEDARIDRMRSLKSGLSLGWHGYDTQNFLKLEIEWGLDLFGARLDNFIDPDDPRQKHFFATRLHYVRLIRPLDNWTVRLDGYAQHSSDTLPSIKRFKVGGGRIGRGFEAATLYGDTGLGGRLEVKRQLRQATQFAWTTDAYAYYDLGAAWRDDLSGRESASSAGLGVTVRGDRLSGHLELARPLTRADVDGRRDATIFGELAWRF